MPEPKDKDWMNEYKNKTPIYVVYKRPNSKQGTHTVKGWKKIAHRQIANSKFIDSYADILYQLSHQGSPNSSVGKESACNAGDPRLIPGSGISPGEGIGYPLKYSWASLVAQMVKNMPAMQETQVLSLGGEDPLEKSMATHSSILAWRIPWTEEPGRHSP